MLLGTQRDSVQWEASRIIYKKWGVLMHGPNWASTHFQFKRISADLSSFFYFSRWGRTCNYFIRPLALCILSIRYLPVTIFTVNPLAIRILDFNPRNKFVAWMTGGLNNQVIHHLFPHISRVHYAKVNEIMTNYLAKHNLPYHSWPTFTSALVSHYRMVKKLALTD